MYLKEVLYVRVRRWAVVVNEDWNLESRWYVSTRLTRDVLRCPFISVNITHIEKYEFCM